VEENVILAINRENGSTDMIRRAEDARAYRDAVLKVGKERDVPVVDVWDSCMQEVGWKGDGKEDWKGVLPGSEEGGLCRLFEALLYDGELTDFVF
jgi:hypothetical protein